mmetsp:Transcript_93184/g.234734  ORF Transcript_93184/g.234734 Transcript_93184/m.234734 type:complete len:192 (+) Transcript_93184:2-577(+)
MDVRPRSLLQGTRATDSASAVVAPSQAGSLPRLFQSLGRSRQGTKGASSQPGLPSARPAAARTQRADVVSTASQRATLLEEGGDVVLGEVERSPRCTQAAQAAFSSAVAEESSFACPQLNTPRQTSQRKRQQANSTPKKRCSAATLAGLAAAAAERVPRPPMKKQRGGRGRGIGGGEDGSRGSAKQKRAAT